MIPRRRSRRPPRSTRSAAMRVSARRAASYEGEEAMTAKRGARKQAIHKGERGPGANRTRPPRMNNLPVDDDEQTRLEAEIAGSGRTDLRPREGLAGAHNVR